MSEKIEFKDIDGVQICVGDEVLVTHGHYQGSASVLRKAKVKRFTAKYCFFKGRRIQGKMMYNQTNERVLVMKGEFVKYTKTKDLKNGSI